MMVTPHLKLWLPFEGDVLDKSGTGNNGTLSGATLIDDQFGKVCSVVGADKSVIIPYDSSFDIPSDLTIFFRAKFLSISTSYEAILGRGMDSSWHFYKPPNSTLLVFRNSSSNAQDNPGLFLVPIGSWCSIAVTFSKSYVLTAYLNGVKRLEKPIR